MKFVFLLLILAGGVDVVNAQAISSHPAPPPGPLIQKRAPDYSCWSLALKLPESTNSNSSSNPVDNDSRQNFITKTTVTKTGNVIRVQFTDNEGRTWETWIKGTQEIVVWPDKKSVSFAARPLTPDGFSPIYHDFSSSDFQGFDWISASNFTGIKQVAGKACLVFTDNVKVYGVSQNYSAAIDLQSRFPVQLQTPSGLTSYEFLQAPTALQDLPPNVQALFISEKRKEAALAPRTGPAF